VEVGVQEHPRALSKGVWGWDRQIGIIIIIIIIIIIVVVVLVVVLVVVVIIIIIIITALTFLDPFATLARTLIAIATAPPPCVGNGNTK
jgi:hypothetical protein